MGDSLLSFVMCTILAISLVVATWLASATSVGRDCEKVGSFYQGNKVYKCEVVK
jgi:hypothetical protein